MSVPEGKMSINIRRHEAWLIASALNAYMSHTAPPAALLDLIRPILGNLNQYVEATDGTPPAYLPTDAPT